MAVAAKPQPLTMGLRQAFLEISQLLLPPRCEVCNAFSREVFCPDCHEGIIPIGDNLCAVCGVPFPPGTRHPPTCADCRDRRPAWSFDAARAVGLHGGPLREAVLRLKFDNRTALAPALAEMMAAVALPRRPQGGAGAHAIIPAALHPARRKWRGFDQALLLSRHLGKLTGLPVWEEVLQRVKNTRQQVGMTVAQRAENLRGAFEATRPATVQGAHILLIDDVFTTGATMQAAASALRKAGAASIFALTVTHAPPDWHPAALASGRLDRQ